MHFPTERRHRNAVSRWTGLVAAAALVAGLVACDSPFERTPDTQPPSLTLSGVEDGEVVSTADVTITAVATDDRGVASVRYTVGGGAGTSCDAAGGATWSCEATSLAVGDNEIVITARDDAGNATSRSRTVYYQPPQSASEFDIEIVFFNETFTASQRAAFQTAADRWESIVIGDLQDFPLDREADDSCRVGEPAYTGTVDDLLIFATSFTDAPGGLLGSAGPCLSRSAGDDAGTNAVGFMRFDTEDLDVLENDGDLVETIVHEMGHVLGIGTNWEWTFHDHLDYQPNDDAPDCRTAGGFDVPPTYVGTEGADAWHDLGGSGGVPVEDTGGLGTQCGHWDEATFGDELMTGYLDSGGANPLSALTVRSLEDIGLTVDAAAAEPYALPTGSSLRTTDGYDIAAAETLVPARGTIDPFTGEVEVFPTRPR